MTKEEINTELYQKMFASQEKFTDYLLSLSPQEVLDRAYEYICREDILLSLECRDLPSKEAKALLSLSDPLADIFRDFEKLETNHMSDIFDTMESRAKKTIHKLSGRETR